MTGIAENLEQNPINLERMREIENHPDHEWRIYLAALEYINSGIPVVPIVPNGKILPAKKTGANYETASNELKMVNKWFHPEKGTMRGYNIGIACGRIGGVFAVDVDRHGEEDGILALDELEAEHGPLPPCPTALTPRDGKHFLFRWQEYAIPTTGKLSKSIDTRGGEANNCKSHIVAFPSVIDGIMYKWCEGGKIPDIPKWMMEKLGVPWKRREKGIGRGNENVHEEDLERPIEEHQIKNMLSKISPDSLDYDEWVKIGMSIKSQMNNEQGLAIWDEWSSEGKRYERGECLKRWEGFDDFGTVRGGTLFYHAKESGWEPDKTKNERSGNPFDEIVERMNRQFAVIAIGGKLKILRESNKHETTNGTSYDLLDVGTFEALMANELVLISSGDKPKKVPVSRVWMSHEGRRTYPNGLAMFPDSAVPEGYFNTWGGFMAEPIQGECKLFLKHLKNIVCSGNVDQYEWLMDWVADMFQNPSDPKGCAVVMKGGEGCGKGTFANAIAHLLGPHSVHLVDDSHLTSNFNAHLLDSIFVFADEITWGGNKKTAGKLKGIVTEKHLVGERKGIDAIQYRNMIHLMVASNSEWVIPAGYGSRRWFVLELPDTVIGNHDYFGNIQHELNNGGYEALLYELLSRKIDNINDIRRAPVTKALIVQRALNIQAEWYVKWWATSIEAEDLGTLDCKTEKRGWPKYVLKIDLYKAFETFVIERKGMAPCFGVWAKNMIKDFEIKPMGLYNGKDRSKLKAYVIPSIEDARKRINRIYEGVLSEDEVEDISDGNTGGDSNKKT